MTGAWVLKFPKLRLVVTLKEGAYLVVGEDIDKGETVRVENVCTGVFPIPKFFFFFTSHVFLTFWIQSIISLYVCVFGR